MRRGFTLIEALVGLVLALLLIAFVYGFFFSSQKQGQRLDDQLDRVAGASAITARLEQDLQRAEQLRFEEGALQLTWTASHDLEAGDYGARVTVRYRHEAGGAVRRSEQVTPRDSAPRSREETLGRHRFASVTFQPGATPTSVEVVTIGPKRATDPRDPAPEKIVLEAPLVRRGDYWKPNELP